jgi:pimeloyl-ACP methyl ester carboxylesterase
MTAPLATTAIVQRTIDVGGVRTRVLEVGAAEARSAGAAPRGTEAGAAARRGRGATGGPDGAPILLLHGYADSADTWWRVLELLADRGQRAAAVDLPGFGRADRLLPDEPMYDQYRRVVRATAELLWGDEAPILVGNSMGGALALLSAQERPSPAGVVPIGPAGFDHPVWFRLIEQQPLVRWALNDTVHVPVPVLRGIVARAFRQVAYGDPRRARPEDLERLARHISSVRDVRRLLATGRRLLPELVEPFDLERIDCPVLLVWGERDRMVSPRGARHLLEALPAARLERLAGVGHCPQLEEPELVCDLLSGFRAALRADAWVAPLAAA